MIVVLLAVVGHVMITSIRTKARTRARAEATSVAVRLKMFPVFWSVWAGGGHRQILLLDILMHLLTRQDHLLWIGWTLSASSGLRLDWCSAACGAAWKELVGISRN